MDESLNSNESLIARIRQLEQERDELHKDIEQLCMQQAGPSYLGVATKMHFQRIAGLEQEIENMKKKFAACTRENLNLQEELSEAYRIKSQLADLHSAEVAKNLEAEKQVKFFQGCVAAAFAERDNSIMEAEKAKESEELMSKQFNDLQRRIEELTADCSAQKKLTDELQVSLDMKEEQNKTFKNIIDKFYQIRQHSTEGSEVTSWDNKCVYLLHDPAEMWSFNDTTTAKYISALEGELEMAKKSSDNLQNKLRVGLEIENHLKRRVRELEQKSIHADAMIKNRIAELRHHYSECRVHIVNLLDDGKSLIKSSVDAIDEKIREFGASKAQTLELSPREVNQEEHECRDVHITPGVPHDLLSKESERSNPDSLGDGKDDASKALAQALQEKVATLLLLSQQEERHLLDSNVNTALQRKIEELQRNLLQVTNEKVRALMELAQLKQEYQLLKEKNGGHIDKEKVDVGDKRVDAPEKGGRLTNLLKKTNLKRWVGTLDLRVNEAEVHMDFARLKIENATLKESMESMEHLITSIHRLRLSLVKAKELAAFEGTAATMSEHLNEIVSGAKLVKTALGSSLPISWSAAAEFGLDGGNLGNEASGVSGNSSNEKKDFVTAAGVEMVELLILAAQILKDYTTKSAAVPDEDANGSL
ncbi:TATA element modulatory factor isoform X2 [Morus notabilis]|uniref:TATA element modulatory factor isoform X2 n=1 Tax=Morus notabilis TaxID=981085 RepID=UPI000CED4434|nr:TATA element modulatory factor isoform X2 [Morus notabilis]